MELIKLMQRLGPDLLDEMSRRALLLERIAALQPVGRRQLAARLNMQEREIRTLASVLKEEGFIELNGTGMSLTPKAQEVLTAATEFSRAMRGLNDLEKALSAALGIHRVCVVAGNADSDEHVLQEVGRTTAQHLRGMLQSGSTLAVTGGATMAWTAKAMQSPAPMNVMVVPARGGLGRALETQANTLAAEIATRIGGHHRLIHIPDRLDDSAMQELMKVPEVRETIELLQRANVVLHGIGCAEEAAQRRGMPSSGVRQLIEMGAVGEAFGSYYDRNGDCVMKTSVLTVGSASCQMAAAAAGAHKAEAILSVLAHYPHALLVTDEGAARRMLSVLEEQKN